MAAVATTITGACCVSVSGTGVGICSVSGSVSGGGSVRRGVGGNGSVSGSSSDIIHRSSIGSGNVSDSRRS